jgi:hypothetical protein
LLLQARIFIIRTPGCASGADCNKADLRCKPAPLAVEGQFEVFDFP